MSEQFLAPTQLLGIGVGKELRPHRRARVYPGAFIAGAILSVTLFYAGLGTLRAMDRLPPPPVSDTWCIDRRFAWLRENPNWKNAGLIAEGSSATLRNLDFGVIPPEAQQRGVANAAPCFLTVNQTRRHAPDSAFTDPIHLQWPETAAFTRFVWKEARRQGADLPPLEEEDTHNSVLDDGRKSLATDGGRSGSRINHQTGFSGHAIPVRNVRRGVLPDDLTLADRAELRSGKEITTTTPLLDAITQNTSGHSEGYAVGVPRTYAWCSGSYKPPGYSAPPSDFTAVTGWGQIYPKVGAPAYSNPDGSIIVANAKTYVHLTATQEWILVQDQAKYGITGAHFVSNFSPKATAVEMRLNTEPDGSAAIGAPPPGYNDHFWLTKRGTYPAGSVDGVYVQMEMRTTDPEMKFVANVGADWWRDATADFRYSFVNNPGAGMSNWVELSTQWSTLRFYSWSTSKLLTDPPPPLAEPKPAPVLVRRLASTSPPCLSPPKARRSN